MFCRPFHLTLKSVNSPSGASKLEIEPAVGIIFKDSNLPNTIILLKNQTEVDLKDNTTVMIGG